MLDYFMISILSDFFEGKNDVLLISKNIYEDDISEETIPNKYIHQINTSQLLSSLDC
jgi:hypothetical protein